MTEKRLKIQTIMKQINQYYFREAKLLVELLEENGVSRIEIASKLDVTPQAIARRFPKEE
jgi:predicted ArsR family transcriptional regulator